MKRQHEIMNKQREKKKAAEKSYSASYDGKISKKSSQA